MFLFSTSAGCRLLHSRVGAAIPALFLHVLITLWFQKQRKELDMRRERSRTGSYLLMIRASTLFKDDVTCCNVITSSSSIKNWVLLMKAICSSFLKRFYIYRF